MKPRMAFQATLLHKRLLTYLTLISLLILMYFHMLLQSSEPRKGFAANVTSGDFAASVPRHVISQTSLGEELGITFIAKITPLL